MTQRAMARRGFLLIAVLGATGIVGILLGTTLSLVSHDLRMATIEVARVQALYLAEAGLNAAKDRLAEDWDQRLDPAAFPFRELVSYEAGGDARTLGELDVSLTRLSPDAVQITSTGRGMMAAGSSTPMEVARRTLSMTLTRRRTPRFERREREGTLELATTDFDRDGLPDTIAFSGSLEDSPHPRRHDPMAEVLSDGGRDARQAGYHLAASFSDVDLDGDLDLLLSDDPSRRDDESHRRYIRSSPLSPGEDEQRPSYTVGVALFGAARPVPVTVPGWIWYADGALPRDSDSVDVFINSMVDDGVIASTWSELPEASP